MTGQYGRPSAKSMDSQNDFLDYVASAATTPGGAPRTTASAMGIPQYAATSFSVSDILQGTFAVRDPSDTLLVVNKALTQDLTGLFHLGADEVSSFSNKPSDVLTKAAGTTPASGGATGSGTTGGLDPTTGTIAKEFVAALPLDHPTTKAIIWQRQGKASREMHVGTSPDPVVDLAQHRHNPDLPPTWRHPWNMDRFGDVPGSTIYYDVNAAPTVLGEDASLGGPSGAFGTLTPQEEEWYCSMAWPYGSKAAEEFITAGRQDIADKITSLNLKQSDYRGKRVLVYSTDTGTACVCIPGDWGAHPQYQTGAVIPNPEHPEAFIGFVIGLSPDVHWALRTDHGSEVMLGWVDDATPLGPYSGASNSAIIAPSGVVTGATASAPANDIARAQALKARTIQPELVPLPGHAGAQMDKIAAASFGRVEQDYGKSISNVGTFRTAQQQINLFLQRYSPTAIEGQSTKVWQGKTYWLKKGQSMAGTPGTSLHECGLAIDVNGDTNNLTDPKLIQTFLSNGWYCATPKAEPWHWSYGVSG